MSLPALEKQLKVSMSKYIVTLSFLSKVVQLEIATSNISVLGTLWTPLSCPTLKSALLLAIPRMIAIGKSLLSGV